MNLCPHCRTDAPIVYRGVMAYCTACGAPRIPLASASVTLAGTPARVGGTVAKAFGWLVLVGGLSLGLMLGLLLTALFPSTILGLAVGVPIALATSIIGWLLLRSGKTITASGEDAQRGARLQAVHALASHRGGIVRAHDVARSLAISQEEADAFLTDLAKTQSDRVTLELDDAGGIYFRFAPAPGAPIPSAWAPGPNVRVDTGHAAPPPREGGARVAEVIEAELIDEPEPRGAARRR